VGKETGVDWEGGRVVFRFAQMVITAATDSDAGCADDSLFALDVIDNCAPKRPSSSLLSRYLLNMWCMPDGSIHQRAGYHSPQCNSYGKSLGFAIWQPKNCGPGRI
jgi:hypothetical protein